MSLFQSLSVSASGMSAQRFRTELLAQNIANSETTRTEEGGPYRRQDAVFQSAGVSSPFSSAFQSSLDAPNTGVAISEVQIDDKDPILRYMPGHPDADQKGYVAFPNFNPIEEMVDMTNASRSFGANVTAMNAVKDMISKSIDLLRG
ncbi:flagellar basal body rod protein FlgC [Bryobacter aggregatus]|uniref:flagellar basal body rod protein FlgC n=1 Tax=Bryobacter aggregatus TaxID=360054 RepID=UPI0004E203E0|nr:flagellar basal body rod protein FlgC [Bryobacter aggregatus]